MGIVVNEELAKKTPCTCFALDGNEICHTKGIIGFLSDKQEKLYCPTKEIAEMPPKLEERHEQFTEAAHKCSLEVREKFPKGERLMPYLKCMGLEAEKRGIEL